MKKEEPDVLLPEWDMLPDIGLYMDQVVTLMERTPEGNFIVFGATSTPARQAPRRRTWKLRRLRRLHSPPCPQN